MKMEMIFSALALYSMTTPRLDVCASALDNVTPLYGHFIMCYLNHANAEPPLEHLSTLHCDLLHICYDT